MKIDFGLGGDADYKDDDDDSDVAGDADDDWQPHLGQRMKSEDDLGLNDDADETTMTMKLL